MRPVGAPPMERWKRERIRDGVWNGLVGVHGDYVDSSQNNDGWAECEKATKGAKIRCQASIDMHAEAYRDIPAISAFHD